MLSRKQVMVIINFNNDNRLVEAQINFVLYTLGSL
jgi:hypothetical protein